MNAKSTARTMDKTYTRVTAIVILLFSSAAVGQSVQPAFTDRFNKIIGEVSQLKGGDLVGNSWFYGSDGCLVMTNYHVAFGKTKTTVKDRVSGKDIERIVMVDNPSIGHKVKLNFDFNPKSKAFTRSVVATVAATGNWEDGTIAGTREDMVLLRLENCVGSEFAGFNMDRSDENQKNPPGKMMVVSSVRSADGKTAIVSQTGCRATVKTPGAGLVATSCALAAGMSGSMLLAEETLQIVGINVRSLTFEDGLIAGIAISAKYLNRFLDDYSGQQVMATSTIADDRKPQSDEQTAMATITKPRTVVR